MIVVMMPMTMGMVMVIVPMIMVVMVIVPAMRVVVVMAVMMVMIVVTMVRMIMCMRRFVSAAFWLERRFDVHHLGAECLQQRVDRRIALRADAVR